MASRRQERLNDPYDEDEEAAQMYLDKNTLKPDTPNFSEYYEAEKQGVHPFDRIKNSFDREKDGTPWEDRHHEEQRETELYRREILGRLFGGDLTPRQYELLTGLYREEDLHTKRVRDAHNEVFMTNKTVIRLTEEYYEKVRRQRVLSGEWREEESLDRIQSLIEDDEGQLMKPEKWRKYKRDFTRFMKEVALSENPDSLLEKEYHFDEKSGVSLKEHVSDLKSKLPEA